MAESGGEPLTDKQLEAVLKELDENKDGKLSFDELYAYMAPSLSV
jgi:Ca2+-binding EF-hand superfamily protein